MHIILHPWLVHTYPFPKEETKTLRIKVHREKSQEKKKPVNFYTMYEVSFQLMIQFIPVNLSNSASIIGSLDQQH